MTLPWMPLIDLNVLVDTGNLPTYNSVTPEYDSHLDVLYGCICCICFALGLAGNIASFMYFRSKKKDVSNTIYKIITVNDSVICMAVLPVGLCFLSDRQSGIVFGNKILCNAWIYIWNTNSRLSIFLVIVLSFTRTYSLLRPFSSIKTLPVESVIVLYFVSQIFQLVLYQVLDNSSTVFDQNRAACTIALGAIDNPALVGYLRAVMIITLIVPMFVVGVSCVLSIRAILAKVERGCDSTSLAVVKLSRNRATITILLFAAVYAVFNIPLVVSMILWTIDAHYGYSFNFHSFDYNPRYYFYYENFVLSVSVALNSAINPFVYLWRMAGFRSFIKGIKDKRRQQTLSLALSKTAKTRYRRQTKI